MPNAINFNSALISLTVLPPERTGSPCGLPVGFQKLLGEQNGPVVHVEDRVTHEHVEDHQVALLHALVRDNGANGDVIVPNDSGESAGAFARKSQRTIDHRQRIAEEREVVLARRANANDCVIRDCGIERPIEGDGGRRCFQHAVEIGGGAKANELTFLRSDSESVDGDRIVPASRVTSGEVDRTRRVDRNDRIVSDGFLQARPEDDGRGVAQRVRVRHDTLRRVIAGDREPRTVDQAAGDAIDCDRRVALSITGRVVDQRGYGLGASGGHVRRIDGGEVLKAVQLTEVGFAERRIRVVAGVRRVREIRVLQKLRLGLRSQHQIPAVFRKLVEGHDFAEPGEAIDDIGRTEVVEAAITVLEETVRLEVQYGVGVTSFRPDGRNDELVDERLHRERLLAVPNHERDVDVVVQLHVDAIGERSSESRHRRQGLSAWRRTREPCGF